MGNLHSGICSTWWEISILMYVGPSGESTFRCKSDLVGNLRSGVCRTWWKISIPVYVRPGGESPFWCM